MAGDWFHLDDDLPDKPEIHNMAARLGAPDSDTVVGKCARFWAWVDRHLATEIIPHPSVTNVTAERHAGVTEAWIDGVVRCPGFVAAMLEVGWLRDTPEGLLIPGFEERFSQSAKRRLLTAKRNQRLRGKERHERDVGSVTAASPREEKRERRDEKNPPTPQGDMGGGIPGIPSPPKAERIDWQGVMDRWNTLAVPAGASRVQVLSQKTQGRYRAQLKRFPEWWETLEAWLPRVDPSWFKWLDFVWFLSEENWAKFLGHKVDRYGAPFGGNGRRPKTKDDELQEFARREAEREGISLEEYWARDAEITRQNELEAQGKEAF